MVYLVVFLCVFNIITWIVFLRNFKKLFTTDNLIESAKAECNKIIIDLNKNADRNITILDDRSKKLQLLINEADRKVKVLMDIEKQGIGVAELQNKITGIQHQKNNSNSLKRALDSYSKNKTYRTVDDNNLNSVIDSNRTVELTELGKNNISSNSQKTLFDENTVPINTKIDVTVDTTGASYAEIPVVTPEVFVKDKLSVSKADLKSKILVLFDSGMTVDEIAENLSCSTTEVQFALTLENRI